LYFIKILNINTMGKPCKKCKIHYGKRRHSRVSGIDGYGETSINMLAIAAGAIGAKFIRPYLDKVAFIAANPKIGDAILAAGGLVGSEMISDKNAKNVLLGVSAMGTVNLVASMLPSVGYVSTFVPPVAVGGGQSFTPPAALAGDMNLKSV
jgi:hypothetical protein